MTFIEETPHLSKRHDIYRKDMTFVGGERVGTAGGGVRTVPTDPGTGEKKVTWGVFPARGPARPPTTVTRQQQILDNNSHNTTTVTIEQQLLDNNSFNTTTVAIQQQLLDNNSY